MFQQTSASRSAWDEATGSGCRVLNECMCFSTTPSMKTYYMCGWAAAVWYLFALQQLCCWVFWHASIQQAAATEGAMVA